MYPMPTFVISGVLWPRYASNHFIQTSSTQSGSLPLESGKSGKQLHPLAPGRSTWGVAPHCAGRSNTVAVGEIGAGPADVAFAIFCAFVIVDFVIMSPRIAPM